MKFAGRFLALIFALLTLSAPAYAFRTVVIDAGHGGHDRGGGPRQRLPEKTYTLDVAKRLRSVLNRAGYRTVMTRTRDEFISLGQRCAVANSQWGAVFVSIHFNSAPREGATGIETYYSSGGSANLAVSIHREVVDATRAMDRGVRRRGFYVLRHTRAPAVIAELGFLSNRAEARKIKSSRYRRLLASAIGRGISKAY